MVSTSKYSSTMNLEMWVVVDIYIFKIAKHVSRGWVLNNEKYETIHLDSDRYMSVMLGKVQ